MNRQPLPFAYGRMERGILELLHGPEVARNIDPCHVNRCSYSAPPAVTQGSTPMNCRPQIGEIIRGK